MTRHLSSYRKVNAKVKNIYLNEVATDTDPYPDNSELRVRHWSHDQASFSLYNGRVRAAWLVGDLHVILCLLAVSVFDGRLF